jgi:hypothetical protein
MPTHNHQQLLETILFLESIYGRREYAPVSEFPFPMEKRWNVLSVFNLEYVVFELSKILQKSITTHKNVDPCNLPKMM